MTKYLLPENYLPHRPPMVLIDKVLEVTNETALCESYVREDGVLRNFLNENSELPSYFTIELIAQTV